MPELIPVNISANAAVAAAHAALPEDSKKQIDIPQPPEAKLLCNWTQENRSLNANSAASVGFPVGQVDGDMDRQVLIFGSSRWADVETTEHVFRYGVSLRVVVQVSNLKVQGALTLPLVAAHVEVKEAQASAELIIRGYNGALGDELPTWQSFGVEQYAQYMESVSKLQSTIMKAPTESLVPQLLATTAVASALRSTSETSAIVHAVAAIAHGQTLQQALAQQSETAAAQIRGVYKEAGIEDDVAQPDNTARDRARQLLTTWGVESGIHSRLRWLWQ